MLTLIATTITGLASADPTILAQLDSTQTPYWKWINTNDPVMGGASTSTWVVDQEQNIGVFNGTCAIVDFLQAPGFAKVTTARSLFNHFPDVSEFINGTMQLRVRSSTPDYEGFKFAWAAKGVPKTSQFGGGSFKTEFFLQGTDWQTVTMPMSSFSYDWSGYTGTCDFKDPSGQQHHCCSEDHPEVCPTAEFLSQITDVEVWAEGVKGDFHIEIDWVGAGPVNEEHDSKDIEQMADKRACENYLRIENGECADACLKGMIGLCPRSMVVELGGLSKGLCRDHGYTSFMGVTKQSAGPCGTLSFNQYQPSESPN
jgi:hypothetical protein